MPNLAGIAVYPIKAFDPHHCSEVRMGAGGQLEHDREFALFDPQGKYVNARRQAKTFRLRAQYDLNEMSVSLREEGKQDAQRFQLLEDRRKLETFFGDYFGFPVRFERNEKNGFPDDPKEWGPTVISKGTLQEVAGWFPGLQPEDVWRRFRANLVIGETEAFWEDRLFGRPGEPVSFQIGPVRFQGTNPCVRCAVPTHDPIRGESWPDFARIFMEKRKAALPAWAEAARFSDTFYRLSVNTRVGSAEAGKDLKVGDEVSLIGST